MVHVHPSTTRDTRKTISVVHSAITKDAKNNGTLYYSKGPRNNDTLLFNKGHQKEQYTPL